MRLHIFAFIVLLSVQGTKSYSQAPLRNLLEVYGTPGSNMTLGTGILGLGDINNDGWPDFAVSAHNIGKTFIYFGGPGKLDGIADVTLRGGDNMVMGDFNGDGRKDLIIHQGFYKADMVDSIFVYFGKTPSPLAIDTIPRLIIAAEKAGDYFGSTMAIGDLNNDGFDDLVVGAPFYSSARGKVYVYFGKSMLSNTPDLTVTGDSIETFYGYNIQISDINGDGISDLAIGSGVFNTREKTLDIYRGRKGLTFTKNGYSQHLSSLTYPVQYLFLFSLCDVNVDGKADIFLISAQQDSAFFFYGRSDSIRYTPDLIFVSPDTTRWKTFMGTCFDIGDINGDGKRDFVLGAYPGGGPAATILVYLGFANPVNIPVALRSRGFVGSDAFYYVAGVGDVDGNGVNDFGACVPRNYSGSSQDGYFVILSGDKTFTEVNDKEEIPSEFSLSQNYPNPFNPSTAIEFSLPKRSHVVLIIYDSLGKEVKTIVDQEFAAGHQKAAWDGRDSSGQRVASRVYFYRMVIDGKPAETKRLLLLK